MPRRCRGGAEAVPRRCRGGVEAVVRRYTKKSTISLSNWLAGAEAVLRPCQGGAEAVQRGHHGLQQGAIGTRGWPYRVSVVGLMLSHSTCPASSPALRLSIPPSSGLQWKWYAAVSIHALSVLRGSSTSDRARNQHGISRANQRVARRNPGSNSDHSSTSRKCECCSSRAAEASEF